MKMIFKNWKSKSEIKRESAKKELDIKHLNNRNVIADEITNIQLDIIDRLKAENNELRAEIERLKIVRELNMRVNMCSAKDRSPFGLS